MQQIAFVLIAAIAIFIFTKKIIKIRRNIFMGKPTTQPRNDNKPQRLKNMAMVALGQSKMVVRPVAGFFHVLIYVGFVLINIEVAEIFIDGIFGTHRFFAPYLGSFYAIAIGFFEVLAVLVIVACVVFFWRRNVQKIQRFHAPELSRFPRTDANIILLVEVVLMTALLLMNAVEANMVGAHYTSGGFVVSQFIAPIFSNLDAHTLHIAERGLWWAHILGIFAFLNYLPYSKHFHIIMAFPNTYYADLAPAGTLHNMPSVTREVRLMTDPNADPYATPDPNATPEKFGAKDVMDLSWKNLMDAYSCTECGRCTDVCPANITGKKLSPRKIMMDTRDRLEEVSDHLDKKGTNFKDNKSLLGDYISHEEIRACTTCNACVQACPISINPVGIIIELRRYAMMEESNVPTEWVGTFGNIENNGAPWAFAAANRGGWAL
jgi:heterodisulfide reductase subunit C